MTLKNVLQRRSHMITRCVIVREGGKERLVSSQGGTLHPKIFFLLLLPFVLTYEDASLSLSSVSHGKGLRVRAQRVM